MSLIPRRENKNIEFKERLNAEIHLKEERKQQLASQMKYLLDLGKGTAIYIIGVDDGGNPKGLNELEFEETTNALRVIASENNARIMKIERFMENGSLIGKVMISKIPSNGIKSHIVISASGHVNHGKSTLVGTLITGKPDTNGKNWLFLDTLPHEIERNLSADLHYAVFGFKNDKPIHLKNPLDKKERSRLVGQSDKLISFIDTPGHDGFLRTAIRGVVGQNIDYGFLVIAADDGVTQITKEHLGIMFAVNLPVVACITKTDKVSNKRVLEVAQQIEELLKNVGRIPFTIKNENDIPIIIDKLDTIVPLIRTSSVNLEGYDLLNKLMFALPERRKNVDEPFLMFIDRIYNISGVGSVVSGTIKQGLLKAGQELQIGPDSSGRFKKVRAPSIEMHYHPLEEADAGSVVGIAIKGIKIEDIRRGMILCGNDIKPIAVKSFKAEVVILNHPTRVATGYEPILHCNTVAETVKLELLNKDYLKSGELGQVRMTFKYQPQFIREGDKFVFREGKTKGIGTVTKIEKFAGS